MSTPERDDTSENPELEVDLPFQKPIDPNFELVQYFPSNNVGEGEEVPNAETLEGESNENTETVNADLLFRLPTDIQFELIHTILGNFVDPLPDSVPISEEQHYDDSVISEIIPSIEHSTRELNDTSPPEQAVSNENGDQDISNKTNDDQMPLESNKLDEEKIFEEPLKPDELSFGVLSGRVESVLESYEEQPVQESKIMKEEDLKDEHSSNSKDDTKTDKNQVLNLAQDNEEVVDKTLENQNEAIVADLNTEKDVTTEQGNDHSTIESDQVFEEKANSVELIKDDVNAEYTKNTEKEGPGEILEHENEGTDIVPQIEGDSEVKIESFPIELIESEEIIITHPSHKEIQPYLDVEVEDPNKDDLDTVEKNNFHHDDESKQTYEPTELVENDNYSIEKDVEKILNEVIQNVESKKMDELNETERVKEEENKVEKQGSNEIYISVNPPEPTESEIVQEKLEFHQIKQHNQHQPDDVFEIETRLSDEENYNKTDEESEANIESKRSPDEVSEELEQNPGSEKHSSIHEETNEKDGNESDANEQVNKQNDEIFNETDTEKLFEQEVRKLENDDSLKPEQTESDDQKTEEKPADEIHEESIENNQDSADVSSENAENFKISAEPVNVKDNSELEEPEPVEDNATNRDESKDTEQLEEKHEFELESSGVVPVDITEEVDQFNISESDAVFQNEEHQQEGLNEVVTLPEIAESSLDTLQNSEKGNIEDETSTISPPPTEDFDNVIDRENDEEFAREETVPTVESTDSVVRDEQNDKNEVVSHINPDETQEQCGTNGLEAAEVVDADERGSEEKSAEDLNESGITEPESISHKVSADFSENDSHSSVNETITEQPITIIEVDPVANEQSKDSYIPITEVTISTTVESQENTLEQKDDKNVAISSEASTEEPVGLNENSQPVKNESSIEKHEEKKFKALPGLIYPTIKKTRSIDAAIANLDLLAEPIIESEVEPPATTKHEMLYTIKENIHDPTGDDKNKKKHEGTSSHVNHSIANDYVPFGTEIVPDDPFRIKENEEVDVCVLCDIVDDETPRDVPYKQWNDEDVISLHSLKTLVAEVGCVTETQESVPDSSVVDKKEPEETLKILKICPSETELLDLDDDIPDALSMALNEELEDEVFETDPEKFENPKEDIMSNSVITESELNEMNEEKEGNEDQSEKKDKDTIEHLNDRLLENEPLEQEREMSKTPTFEKTIETTEPETAIYQKSAELNNSLESDTVDSTLPTLNVLVIDTEPSITNQLNVEHSASPISPNTVAGYDQIPEMGMVSVPDSPQEKFELKVYQDLKNYDKQFDEENSEGLDSIGDLSERTIQRFNSSFDDPLFRRDSFSSISSFGDRQKFRTAIDNIRQDLLPFQSSISQYLDPQNEELLSRLTMDSPSDLSPNAPPTGFENPGTYFANLEQNREVIPAGKDQPSGEGSLDSSEFEKVEHEGLEDYGQHGHVSDPMQQSIFGSLQGNEHDKQNPDQTTPLLRYDDGFLLIDKNEIEKTLKSSKMSHDDVIEKNYFHGDDSTTAKLLESPIAEEARKLVQDAVESASDFAKSAHDAGDDIAKELDQHAHHEFENIHDKASDIKQEVKAAVEEPSSVKDILEKTHDGLTDFVEEKVPEAFENVKNEVNDFVEEHKPQITEPVKHAVDDLYDIHDDATGEAHQESIGKSVEQVHDEVDNFLKDVHREPSPLITSEFVDEPHFGEQTPEEEETTYDRKGPLTIPEEEKNDDFSDFDPLVSTATGAAFGSAIASAIKEEDDFEPPKFESVPRPPTPPKDITDEVVQPSTVKLGPAPVHSHPSTPHHSILKHHGSGEPWFDFKTVDPAVLDLIYWRDPKKSAIALSLTLLALFIFGRFPLLSVLSYSGLGLLAATLGFRVFKTIEAQIKKTGGENPFQEILAQDLALPQEKVHAQVDCLVEHGTYLVNRVKKLIFVENILDSVKFGLLLWSLTYIASWFSGFALIFLVVVGVFSIPKLYETYQEPIDAHLAVLNGHIQNVQNLLEEKIPFLRRAPVVVEEKKDQ